MQARKIVWNFLPFLILATALLLLAGAAQAQVTTVGGKVTPTGATVPVKVGADGTLTTSGTAAVTVGGTAVSTANPMPSQALPGFVTTGAPSFSLAVSTTSAYATGLTASGCYRVACSGTVYWRTGTGTPTALTSDNPFFGPAVESLCLPSTDTVLAAVTQAGTATCTGTALARTP